MSKLFVKLGKYYGEERWEVVLGNSTNTYHINCDYYNEWSSPMPGAELEDEEIKLLIELLQQTLEEKGVDERQSNLE